MSESSKNRTSKRSLERGRMGNWKVTCACASASLPDWSEIDQDILELILLKLPEISVIRASCVCTRWNSLARSEKFTQFYVQQVSMPRACPRFKVKGSTYCFQQNEVGQYDALTAIDCLEVPYLLRPDVEMNCSEGAGGLFYFFTGPGETVLHYKISVMQREWLVTPEMNFRRHEPIVGAVRNGVNWAHKLVVAGGMADVQDNDEDLVVEIYDSTTRSWEIGSPLPHVFRGCTTSLFMNPAVYDGKLYAYDNYASFCSVLDVSSNRWSGATVVKRPFEVKQSYLVESSTGLTLVGVQNSGSRELSFCVWNVDPNSLQLKEQTQNTVVLNARRASPSLFRHCLDRFLDQVGSVVGMLLLLLAYVIVLSYGCWTRSRCHLKNLFLSFSSRAPCSSHAVQTESRDVAEKRWLPWSSS